MPTPAFLQSVIELAACESLDELLDHALVLLERDTGLRARIELWGDDGAHFVRGAALAAPTAHCSWIGLSYTIGAIQLERSPPDRVAVDLLAMQIASLAERLIERELSRRSTIREDVDRLYDRRILDALVRCDWNASAVARELRVSRNRVANVVRCWRGRASLGARNHWKSERTVM